MMNIVNPLTYPGWDRLLLSQDTCSFFHSSPWARVLHETYGYRPLYFSLIDQGKLSILIPLMEVKSLLTGKRGVSLPFSDFCEIVVSEKIDFEEVMNSLIEYGKGARWKSIELTDSRYFPRNTVSCSYYYDYTLDLAKGGEAVFSTFHESTRRSIRKAIKENVVITKQDSEDSIAEFYRLHCLTRKRHGLPPQPYRFFKNIYKDVISTNHGFVMLASHENKTVAASIYFHFGDQAMFKYGASDLFYQHLRANNLIMWTAIQWFSRNEYKRLSLGRTEPDNEGLKRFKKGWGTDERMIKYYKYDLLKGAFVHDRFQLSEGHKKILRNLPPLLLRTAGTLLYRHIG